MMCVNRRAVSYSRSYSAWLLRSKTSIVIDARVHGVFPASRSSWVMAASRKASSAFLRCENAACSSN